MTADDRVHRAKPAAAVAPRRLSVRSAMRPKLASGEFRDKLSRGEKAEIGLEEGARQAIEISQLG
jgi:hypothetical protein